MDRLIIQCIILLVLAGICGFGIFYLPMALLTPILGEWFMLIWAIPGLSGAMLAFFKIYNSDLIKDPL